MKRTEGNNISMAVPVGLVDVANREGWTRSLAYWLLAKNTFRNASIYDFSVKRLSTVLGISYHCAKTHYTEWVKQGLVRLRKTTLQFCGWKEMSAVASRFSDLELSYNNRIRINMFSNVQDQIMCLQARAVLKNINTQIFSYKKKCEVLNNLKLVEKFQRLTQAQFRAFKKARNFVKKNFNGDTQKLLKTLQENICISNKNITELVGCSLSYANKLKKFLNLAGILTTEKLKGRRVSGSKMSKQTYFRAKEYSDQYKDTFFYRGYAYEYPKTGYSLGYAVSPKWMLTLFSVEG